MTDKIFDETRQRVCDELQDENEITIIKMYGEKGKLYMTLIVDKIIRIIRINFLLQWLNEFRKNAKAFKIKIMYLLKYFLKIFHVIYRLVFSISNIFTATFLQIWLHILFTI